jgi:effector-binding domain-containing protein
MRLVRTVITLILVAVGVAAIMALVMPTSIKVERSIVINAKPDKVYAYLASLENFNKWSVWSLTDSTMVNNMNGTDGTIGAYDTWKGHPEISGEGRITIMELLPGEKVKQHISFYSPHKMEADSKFTLLEDNGTTKVTWVFDIATPRPRNIFNLFSSFDKQMGGDFETGLRNLKAAIEKTSLPTTVAYTISPYNFPGATYAMFRVNGVRLDSVTAFINHNALPFENHLGDEERVPGNSVTLLFDEEIKNSGVDIAVASPVDGHSSVSRDSVEVIDLSASKALFTDYHGSPALIQDAIKSFNDYLSSNNLQRKSPIIIEYVVGPPIEPNPSRWISKLIVLVE